MPGKIVTTLKKKEICLAFIKLIHYIVYYSEPPSGSIKKKHPKFFVLFFRSLTRGEYLFLQTHFLLAIVSLNFCEYFGDVYVYIEKKYKKYINII